MSFRIVQKNDRGIVDILSKDIKDKNLAKELLIEQLRDFQKTGSYWIDFDMCLVDINQNDYLSFEMEDFETREIYEIEVEKEGEI